MLDLLLPPRCALCDRAGGGLCSVCASTLVPPTSQSPPPELDFLVCICGYVGTGRDLVLALKRRNRRSSLPVLGAALAEALHVELDLTVQSSQCLDTGNSAYLDTGNPDGSDPIVIWAPTSAPRRRRRGFDQSEVLARSVATASGWPVRGLLRRFGGAQMGRDRDQRLAGVSFECTGPAPPVVVVVDDVVTSGATMSAAARALRQAGARSVLGAAVATG